MVKFADKFRGFYLGDLTSFYPNSARIHVFIPVATSQYMYLAAFMYDTVGLSIP